MIYFRYPSFLILLITFPFVLLLSYIIRHMRIQRLLKIFNPERVKELGYELKIFFIQSWILSVAVLFFIIAGSKPYIKSKLSTDVVRNGYVILLIDVSRSMLASDIKPSRLHKAILDATEFVRAYSGVSFGVVTFRGNPRRVCPITSDIDFVIQLLNDIDLTYALPGPTDIGSALIEAADMLKDLPSGGRAIVLFTDGEDLTRGRSYFENLKIDIPVIVVGYGSKDGFEMVSMDKDGNVYKVRTMLNEDILKRIADISGGYYFNSADAVDVAHLVYLLSGVLDKLMWSFRKEVVSDGGIDLTSIFIVSGFLLILLVYITSTGIYRWQVMRNFFRFFLILLLLFSFSCTPKRHSNIKLSIDRSKKNMIEIKFIPSLVPVPFEAIEAVKNSAEGNYSLAVPYIEKALIESSIYNRSRIMYNAVLIYYLAGYFDKATNLLNLLKGYNMHNIELSIIEGSIYLILAYRDDISIEGRAYFLNKAADIFGKISNKDEYFTYARKYLQQAIELYPEIYYQLNVRRLRDHISGKSDFEVINMLFEWQSNVNSFVEKSKKVSLSERFHCLEEASKIEADVSLLVLILSMDRDEKVENKDFMIELSKKLFHQSVKMKKGIFPDEDILGEAFVNFYALWKKFSPLIELFKRAYYIQKEALDMAAKVKSRIEEMEVMRIQGDVYHLLDISRRRILKPEDSFEDFYRKFPKDKKNSIAALVEECIKLQKQIIFFIKNGPFRDAVTLQKKALADMEELLKLLEIDVPAGLTKKTVFSEEIVEKEKFEKTSEESDFSVTDRVLEREKKYRDAIKYRRQLINLPSVPFDM